MQGMAAANAKVGIARNAKDIQRMGSAVDFVTGTLGMAVGLGTGTAEGNSSLRHREIDIRAKSPKRKCCGSFKAIKTIVFLKSRTGCIDPNDMCKWKSFVQYTSFPYDVATCTTTDDDITVFNGDELVWRKAVIL